MFIKHITKHDMHIFGILFCIAWYLSLFFAKTFSTIEGSKRCKYACGLQWDSASVWQRGGGVRVMPLAAYHPALYPAV